MSSVTFQATGEPKKTNSAYVAVVTVGDGVAWVEEGRKMRVRRKLSSTSPNFKPATQTTGATETMFKW